jgi:hypothetical protein
MTWRPSLMYCYVFASPIQILSGMKISRYFSPSVWTSDFRYRWLRIFGPYLYRPVSWFVMLAWVSSADHLPSQSCHTHTLGQQLVTLSIPRTPLFPYAQVIYARWAPPKQLRFIDLLSNCPRSSSPDLFKLIYPLYFLAETFGLLSCRWVFPTDSR